jgi:hypothetical protein
MKLTDIVENIVHPAEPMNLIKEVAVSQNLKYHLDRHLTLEECVFRNYSEAYFNLINEIRALYNDDAIELNEYDADIVESDLGETAEYEGRTVYLDAPIEEDVDEQLMLEAKHRGRTVKLNRPFRTPGGPKKFAVYVKSKKGKIKKVTFGDPKMRVRASSKARRKSFSARHKCSQKKDRTTAGYWSCRAHRIRSLGTKSKGKYW